MAVLHLVEGPAGGGKSQHVDELVEAGTVQVVADTTALWVALSGVKRGADGRYPDPRGWMTRRWLPRSMSRRSRCGTR